MPHVRGAGGRRRGQRRFGPGGLLWVVDTIDPVASLDVAPASATSATGATFGFTADEATTFECRLDGAAYTPCTTPTSYAALVPGPHTFDLRATDAAGNTDVVSFGWTIDTTSPVVSFDSTPLTPSDSTDASFSFSADETVSFACRLDGGTYAPCTSPEALTALGEGAHTFDVRGTDGAGNSDIASFSWTIDTTAPVVSIVSGPGDPSGTSTAAFTFSATEPVTFTCSIDGGGFSACVSPQAFTGFADGAHTLAVRGTDAAGNQATDSFGWNVDTSALSVQIDSAPISTTSSTSAAIGFSANKTGVTFTCRLDGGSSSPCASPQSYAGLGEGAHTVEGHGYGSPLEHGRCKRALDGRHGGSGTSRSPGCPTIRPTPRPVRSRSAPPMRLRSTSPAARRSGVGPAPPCLLPGAR